MFGQQRSNSGPGGLSINTGAANLLSTSSAQPPSGNIFGASKPAGNLFSTTTSAGTSAGTLFGTPTSTQGGGNLFGGTTSSAPAQAGTLFGGSTTTSAPSQAGTLFGGTASNQTQPGSLFGGATGNQTQTGSLFGGPNNQAQAGSLFSGSNNQPQAGSLFGGSAVGNQAQGVSNAQQPSTVGSLFGQSNNQANQPGSLFGGMANTAPGAQQPQQAGGSLFGGNAGAAGGSIFNQPRPQVPQLGVNLPASNYSTLNPQQQTQRSIFSTSIGQLSAQQQVVPGVRIDVSNLRPTTHFNELHETLQKEIEQLDNFILHQQKLEADCALLMPGVGRHLGTLPADVGYCAARLDATNRALEADAAAIDTARNLLSADARHARRTFRAIQALRLPAPFQSASLWAASTAEPAPGPAGAAAAAAAGPKGPAPTSRLSADEDDGSASADLVGYFADRADDMGKHLASFTDDVSAIETHLRGVEEQLAARTQAARWSRGTDGRGTSVEDRVRELAAVLREFEGGILKVAGKVGEAREKANEAMLANANGLVMRGL